MEHREQPHPAGDLLTPLLDVSRVSLDVVLRSADSALANSLRRVMDDVRQPGESYAAHGSTP